MTTQDTAQYLAIKKKIEKLTPPQRLHLAAELVEQGAYAIAEVVAGEVVAELTALRLVGLGSK